MTNIVLYCGFYSITARILAERRAQVAREEEEEETNVDAVLTEEVPTETEEAAGGELPTAGATRAGDNEPEERQEGAADVTQGSSGTGDGSTGRMRVGEVTLSTDVKEVSKLVVKNWINDRIWPFVKFTSNGLMEWGEPFSKLAVKELNVRENPEKWWKAWEKPIKDAVKEKRNNVIGGIQKAFVRKLTRR